MSFVHLHCHSHYSLLDGACKHDDLIREAERNEMPALAVTDHGNMFGAIEFYKRAKKSSVKPIIGMEAYVSPGRHAERSRVPVAAFHLTLLCKNEIGYRNLMRIASAGYTEGFYYHPRVDKEFLDAHSEGLIALSGCMKSESNWYYRAGEEKKARESFEAYRQIFGENFFVELMDHGIDSQAQLNERNLKLAQECGLSIVGTNDVHYLKRDDAFAHEVLLCLSTGKTLQDEKRLRYSAEEFYFKTSDEMRRIFRDHPEAIENTVRVADLCNLELDFSKTHLPAFTPDTGETPEVFFRRLCEEGVARRYGGINSEVRARLDREIDVIVNMDYVSYFLITWDFIRFARERGIPVGPGRGSAAGSIVAYALEIIDVDPLKYDLLFERFLNSERVSMPDIDIDFCRDGRAEVIKYVSEKYGGPSNVSQIITFGTLGAKAVIRDVGRVMNIPLPDVDRIAKKIPGGPGVKLGESVEADPDLKSLAADPAYRELFEVAGRLEGTARHSSTHAAGVVISDRPLVEHVPLYQHQGEVATQYSMDHLEDIGLLKMDFLGLKTLTVLDKALKAIERRHGTKIDFDAIGLEDRPTFELLARGDGLGVFQLESEGMRDLLTRLRPDSFEDLIAILALYRPGPLGSGMVDAYIRRKHGEEDVTYLHPALEECMKDTYGVCVYQEQVMRIANRLSGFSLNEADNLRKAMGKKKPEVMAKYCTQFVEGAVANDCPKAVAEEVWSHLEYFAGYGFNKSHTTAYAVISYQTAYLKANYTPEFMAALMSCDAGVTDKIVLYVAECKKLGIAVRRPCVERSSVDFDVGDDGSIRFGLGAVKGVGSGAAEAIVDARTENDEPFGTLFDFCEQVDLQLVNRSTVEALVKGGGLDVHGATRAAVFGALEHAIRVGSEAQADKRAGQFNLFGAVPAAVERKSDVPSGLSDVPEWPEKERLAFEKESLGFYLSSHPLAAHEATLARYRSHRTVDLIDVEDKARVVVAGMVREPRSTFVKKGKYTGRKMGLFKLEDLEGIVPAVVFTDAYDRYVDELTDEAIVFIEGTVDLSRDEPNLKVDKLIPLSKVVENFATRVTLRLPSDAASVDRVLTPVRSLLERHRGGCEVLIDVPAPGGARAIVRAGSNLSVLPTSTFRAEAESLLGRGAIRFRGK